MKVASRFGVSALLVLALALMVMPAVRAGVWNHSTKVTFNNSVQLPGVVLAPGDYRFELLESPQDRHIVRVFNAEHSHVFGTFFTVPVQRFEPTGKTVFVMEERPYGEPEAVKQWFYPGELIGDEFIYGRDKSTAVAAVTPSSTEVVTPIETETTPAVTEEPAVKHEEEAAPVAQPEAAAPVEQEPYQEPAKAAPEKQPEPAKEEELPKTASNVYLFLLIGSITVLSGAAIRRLAKS